MPLTHPAPRLPLPPFGSYVEQQDIHSAGTTVREALMFSARLRLDETTISLEQVPVWDLRRILAGCIALRLASGDS